jgi:AraC-like DNA-binding protein
MDFPTNLKDKIVFESEPDTRVHPGIWRCVRWLEERYSQKICISDLASRAGLSPHHFARSFLEATGCTPHKYLLRLRLLCARSNFCVAKPGTVLELWQKHPKFCPNCEKDLYRLGS